MAEPGPDQPVAGPKCWPKWLPNSWPHRGSSVLPSGGTAAGPDAADRDSGSLGQFPGRHRRRPHQHPLATWGREATLMLFWRSALQEPTLAKSEICALSGPAHAEPEVCILEGSAAGEAETHRSNNSSTHLPCIKECARNLRLLLLGFFCVGGDPEKLQLCAGEHGIIPLKMIKITQVFHVRCTSLVHRYSAF